MGDAYIYGRKVVDTMASQSMHGRGYVNKGDRIAADYLRSEFSKIGLKSFTKNYFQKLSFPINTFPGNMLVKIDGKELIPGKDYIVGERCGTGKGTFTIKRYFPNKDSIIEVRKEDKQNAVFVRGSKYPVLNEPQSPVVYIEKQKLTADLEWNHYKNVIIHLMESSIPPDAQEISFDIENKFVKKHSTQNVVGYIPGTLYPDSFIVFSAHYDHLGQMGRNVYFPGANDNASGCAMLLNVARYYSLPEHKPTCSVVFIAFCGEEAGLLGSKYYVEHPLFPLERIKFLFNMDIMGTGEEGITVVNGTVFKKEFDQLSQINKEHNFIKDVKIRGKASISDHYFFSEKGVHAFFIYTMGGIKAYHDIYDKAETLPLNEFEDLYQLITKFGDLLQKN